MLPMLLQSRFEGHARHYPDSPAIVDTSGTLSYAELDGAANFIANLLRAHGAGPGTIVAVCLPRSTLFVAALLGTLKSGAACLPLDVNDAAERRRYILQDSGAPVVLVSAGTRALLEGSAADKILLDGCACRETEGPSLQTLPPSALALVFYTTGSTGNPKGVMISHGARLDRLSWEVSSYEIRSSDVILLRTPISFARVIKEALWALSSGARIAVAEEGLQNDPAYVIETIRERQVSVAIFTPSLLSMLAAQERFACCRTLQTILSEGEPLRDSLADRILELFPEASLVNGYGMTEVSTVAVRRYLPGAARCGTTIGTPAGLRVYLLDGNLEPVAAGDAGEMYVAGPGIAAGYLNQPELTARQFLPDPWPDGESNRMFQTGDLARLLENGELEYLGRRDSQVKIRGHRVELMEVETAILAHSGVREAAVLCRQDRFGGNRLVAHVSPAENGAVTPTALQAFLKDRLPPYMIPAQVSVAASLPRTANGKLDRQALATRTVSRPDLPSEYVAPQDDLESSIVSVWESTLSIHPIGVMDNFFVLGGDSLSAVLIASEMEELTRVPLPDGVLLEAPTVRALCSFVRSREDAPREATGKGGSPRVKSFNRKGSRAPLVWVGTPPLLLFHELGPDQPVHCLRLRDLKDEETRYSFEEIAASLAGALRQVQPEGPYLLAGFCLTGVIAFEMAHQLIAAGQEVRFLCLLDPPEIPGGAPAAASTPHRTESFQATLRFHLKKLRSFSTGEKLTYILRRTTPRRRSEILLDRMQCVLWRLCLRVHARIGRPMPRSLRSARQVLLNAFRSYRPRAYPESFVIVRPEQRRELSAAGEDLCWKGLCAEELTFEIVPGSHAQMLTDPHVRVLAHRLRTFLTRRSSPALQRKTFTGAASE